MSTMKNADTTKCYENEIQPHLHTLLMEVKLGTISLEVNLILWTKIGDVDILKPRNFTPRPVGKRKKGMCAPRHMDKIVLAALFLILPNWKQFKCSSVECLVLFPCIVKYYAVLEMTDL